MQWGSFRSSSFVFDIFENTYIHVLLFFFYQIQNAELQKRDEHSLKWQKFFYSHESELASMPNSLYKI